MTNRLTATDRVLQKTPFGFDVSVWEFFWPLAFGAQLVIALVMVVFLPLGGAGGLRFIPIGSDDDDRSPVGAGSFRGDPTSTGLRRRCAPPTGRIHSMSQR